MAEGAGSQAEAVVAGSAGKQAPAADQVAAAGAAGARCRAGAGGTIHRARAADATNIHCARWAQGQAGSATLHKAGCTANAV
jgi:hypothetical protein